MSEYNEYRITVKKLLNIVHRYTERIKIRVISDRKSIEDKVREFYLTDNFCRNQEETDRVLKYYAEVPVWNLHIEFDEQPVPSGDVHCHVVAASIVANCHYSDMREGFLTEKEDKRKEQQRERQRRYRKRVKEQKED